LESLGLTSLTILVGQLLHPSDADAIEATTCRQLIVPKEICPQMKRIFVSFSFVTMMKLSYRNNFCALQEGSGESYLALEPASSSLVAPSWRT